MGASFLFREKETTILAHQDDERHPVVRVSNSRLKAYRAHTFHLTAARRLRSAQDALAFVEERGFVFFWPIGGIDLPSLWKATAGDRPVASNHDDPGHASWGWKDELLSEQCWYYGKLLRGKSTIVSLRVLPFFYAMSERVGDLDDYLPSYEEGRLTREAKVVADLLRTRGALDTVGLRRLAHLSSEAAKARFDKAITDLQKGLWIVPIGVAEAGAWRYAFVYELFDHWFPDVGEQARLISRKQAQAHLAGLYLDAVGAAEPRALVSLFRWERPEVDGCLEALAETGRAQCLDDGRWATTEVTGRGEG